MHRLPPITAFDAASYPELSEVFRSIDAGIAAIVAADPAFRAKPAHRRRAPAGKRSGPSTRHDHMTRRTAA